MKKHYSVQYETGDIVFTCIGAALARYPPLHSAGATMLGLLLVIMVMTIWWRKVASPLNRHHAVTVYTTFSWTTLRGSSPVRRSAVEQKLAIMEQVPARLNKFYHTGFKYESSRQFCSKFVFDIYKEALCIPVGDIETFEELLHSNPDAKLAFWKFWF